MAEYFREALGGKTRAAKVSLCVKTLRQLDPKPEAIAVTGLSGGTFGSIVAYKMNLPLILVRKDGDSSHTSEKISYGDDGDYRNVKYVVIDDFVCSGASVWRIVSRVGEENCLGVYCYQKHRSIENADTLSCYGKGVKYIPNANIREEFEKAWADEQEKKRKRKRAEKEKLEAAERVASLASVSKLPENSDEHYSAKPFPTSLGDYVAFDKARTEGLNSATLFKFQRDFIDQLTGKLTSKIQDEIIVPSDQYFRMLERVRT